MSEDLSGFLPSIPRENISIWNEMFRAQEMGLQKYREVTRDQRLMIAYRIAVQIAVIKGWIRRGEPLALLDSMDPSPWVAEVEGFGSNDTYLNPYNRLSKLETMDMSLVPLDSNFPEFLDAASAIADKLALYTIPQFKPILDDLFCEDSWEEWPNGAEILAWESYWLYQIVKQSSQMGKFRIREELLKKYAAMMFEIEHFLSAAEQISKKIFLKDKESEKAYILANIEDIIKRTREIGDVRAELSAIKLYSKLQNLFPKESKSSQSGKANIDLDSFEFVDVEPINPPVKDGEDDE